MDWEVARDNAALEAMLKPCLRKRERVMLLIPGADPSWLDWVREAVIRRGGIPTVPEGIPCGRSLEMVTFPGEKLPRLPTLAKLVERPWQPDSDCPFALSGSNFSSAAH